MALPRFPLSTGLQLPKLEDDQDRFGSSSPYDLPPLESYDFSSTPAAPEESWLGSLSSGLGSVLHNTVGLPKQGIDWLAREMTDEVEPEGTTAGQILEEKLLGKADPNAGFGSSFGRTLLRGGLDIGLDPTTYAAGLGVLSKAGKIGSITSKIGPGVTKALHLADPLFKAQMGLGVAHGLGEGLPELYQHGATGRAGELLGEAAISGGGLALPHFLRGKPERLPGEPVPYGPQPMQGPEPPMLGPDLPYGPRPLEARPDLDYDLTPERPRPEPYSEGGFTELFREADAPENVGFDQFERPLADAPAPMAEPPRPVVDETPPFYEAEAPLTPDQALPPEPIPQTDYQRKLETDAIELQDLKNIFGEQSLQYQKKRTEMMGEQVKLQKDVEAADQQMAQEQLQQPPMLPQEGEQLPLPFDQSDPSQQMAPEATQQAIRRPDFVDEAQGVNLPTDAPGEPVGFPRGNPEPPGQRPARPVEDLIRPLVDVVDRRNLAEGVTTKDFEGAVRGALNPEPPPRYVPRPTLEEMGHGASPREQAPEPSGVSGELPPLLAAEGKVYSPDEIRAMRETADRVQRGRPASRPTQWFEDPEGRGPESPRRPSLKPTPEQEALARQAFGENVKEPTGAQEVRPVRGQPEVPESLRAPLDTQAEVRGQEPQSGRERLASEVAPTPEQAARLGARSDEGMLNLVGKPGEDIRAMRGRMGEAYAKAEQLPSGLKLVDLDQDFASNPGASWLKSEAAQPVLNAIKSVADRIVGGRGRFAGFIASTDIQGQMASGEVTVNPVLLARKAERIVERNVRELARKGVKLTPAEKQAMHLDLTAKKLIHTLAHEQAHTEVPRDSANRSHTLAHREAQAATAQRLADQMPGLRKELRDALSPISRDLVSGVEGTTANKYRKLRLEKNAARKLAKEARDAGLLREQSRALPGTAGGGGAVGGDIGGGGPRGVRPPPDAGDVRAGRGGSDGGRRAGDRGSQLGDVEPTGAGRGVEADIAFDKETAPEMRISESDDGVPPARLSREDVLRFEEGDKATYELATKKTDDYFINQAARGKITPEETKAWGMRVSAKEQAVGDAYAELARAKADGGDISAAQKKSDAIAANYLENARLYSDLGRNVRSRPAPRKGSPLDAINGIIKEFDLNETQSKNLLDIFHNDPNQLPDLIRNIRNPTLFQKLIEGQKAGMVSAIPTQGANLFGNVGEFGAKLGETWISGMVDKYMRGGSRKPAAEVGAELRGAAGASRAGLRELGLGLKEIFSLMPEKWDPNLSLDYVGGAIGKGGRFSEAISKATGKDFHLGRFVRIPLRMLGAGDKFFQTIGRGAEIGKLSFREAVKDLGEKASSKALSERAAEIQNEIHEASTPRGLKLAEEIVQLAKERSFAETPPEFVRSLNALAQKHPAVNIAIPFRTAPGNILRRVYQRSPAGFLKVIRDYRNGKFDGDSAAFADAIARPILGSALLGGFVAAANSGMMTGSGPSDPEEMEMLRSTGWQPYSAVLRNEDGTQTYVPFSRFEPVSSLLSFAADVGTLGDVKDEERADRVLGSLVSNMVSKTYLRGLSDAAMVISDPKKAGGKFLRGVAGTVVPNIVTRTGQAFDPTVYDTRPKSKGFAAIPEMIGNAVLADIPGSPTLQPRYDSTGKIMERPGNAFERAVSPFPTSTSKPNAPLVKELLRVGVTLPEARNSIRLEGVSVPLSQKEQALYSEGHRELESALKNLTSSNAYKKLPDTRAEGGRNSKEGYIRSVIDGINTRTRQKIIANNDFKRRYKTARRETLMGRVPNA